MDNVLALIEQGKIEQAEAQLNQRQTQEEQNPDWRCARALILEAKGHIQEAIDTLETAHQESRDNPNVTFHLARICDLYCEDDRAIDLYESLSKLAPAYVNALLNLAVAYEDREIFEKAHTCVLRVLSEHPNHPRARLFRKDIESSMNMHYDEAQERTREKRDAILDTPVSDFELSVRSRNCLRKMNINTLGDLLRIGEAELLSYKNFGETSLNEIKAMLTQKGLRIGQLKDEAAKAVRPAPLRHAMPTGSPEVINKYLSEIEFSGRSRKCLQRLGLVTLGDLAMKTEAELLATKNFGQTSLNEVKQKLTEYGLSLRK
jgi:DNA-directed RNA polymerase subunit alpha